MLALFMTSMTHIAEYKKAALTVVSSQLSNAHNCWTNWLRNWAKNCCVCIFHNPIDRANDASLVWFLCMPVLGVNFRADVQRWVQHRGTHLFRIQLETEVRKHSCAPCFYIRHLKQQSRLNYKKLCAHHIPPNATSDTNSNIHIITHPPPPPF